MITFHFLAPHTCLETPFYTLIDVLKTPNWDSEIVTLLASRNKNLWWVNRYKLHYWEAWLVISLTAAVRGIHSTAASVLSEKFSLHLQRYKRHTHAHYLLFLCPSANQVPNVFALFYTLTLCFVSPLSMPVCIFSSWQEQKGRKLMWRKGPAGEVSGRKKGGQAVFFFSLNWKRPLQFKIV